MNPKLARETSIETAKEMDLNPFMVEDILSFYWKEIGKELGIAKGKSIQISGVGTFTIKSTKVLQKLLEYYNKVLRIKNERVGANPSKKKDQTAFNSLMKQLSIIENLIKFNEELRKEKVQFKIKKNEQLNKNLEE